MKKIYSLVLGLFILLVGFAQKVSAENIKFIQIADSHLSADSEYSQKVLKSAVDDINNQTDVSFVIFTGDNINNPSEANLRAFVQIVNKLKVPYYLALGNHDVYKSKGMSKARYFEIVREGNIFYPQRRPNYEFKKNGFVFLIVDGAKEVIPGSTGYYRDDTLKWLDEKLEKYQKKSVVIFQHFPVIYPDGVDSQLKTHKTYRVEDYKDVLAKHNNVLAIITGHFHTNSESMENGVYHISSPSVLALPQSYKVIDIVTTKDFSPIIYSQLREFTVEE